MKITYVPIVCLVAVLFFTSNSVVLAATCTIHGPFPDSKCTPGRALPVTAKQVCTAGYSASVRNVSTKTKNAVFAEYGITSHPTGAYEVDHFISLELGGSNDIKNLFPEAALPTPGFHEKDKVENYLHAQVCKGNITLATAQHGISTNWLAVYAQMGGKVSATKTSTIQPAKTTIHITKPKLAQSTSSPAVKKSTSGICHDKTSRYYAKTTMFTPYPSIKACLASGGRLPKN